MNSSYKSSPGFSLIELMIVIAIIGILAAIMVPTYTSYLIRSRVLDAFNTCDVAKIAIADYVIEKTVDQSGGPIWPVNNAAAGVPGPTDVTWGNKVTNVSIVTNSVTIQVDPINTGVPNSLNIYLNATYANGSVSWTCQSSGDVQYAPMPCR